MSRLSRVPLSCRLNMKCLEEVSEPTTRRHNFPDVFSGQKGRHYQIKQNKLKTTKYPNQTLRTPLVEVYLCRRDVVPPGGGVLGHFSDLQLMRRPVDQTEEWTHGYDPC